MMGPLKGTANPAKALLRAEISTKLAELSQEEKKRQSKIIYDKLVGRPWYKSAQRIALYMSTDTEVDTEPLVGEAQARGAQPFVPQYDLVGRPWYKSAQRIALYMSTDTEVDTEPLVYEAQARGAQPFVPQYAGGRMKMLRVLRGDAATMAVTRHGIAQHADGEVREDALETGGLDLVITPGLAFTTSGKRLGHGGGYYDRYLTELLARHAADAANFRKPKVVAIAFKEQLVEDLPVDEHDVLVDEVVTA